MIAKEPEATGSEDWQKIAAAKKTEQGRRIPKEWKLKEEVLAAADDTTDLRPIAVSSGLLSERELLITGDKHDATSLAAAIAAGTYSAEEVVTAFCKRAAIGHQLCNNLTEIMFRDAIEDAKNLDKVFQQTGKTVGPLHGLPMTFKVGGIGIILKLPLTGNQMLTVSSRSAFMSRGTTLVMAIFRGHSTHRLTRLH